MQDFFRERSYDAAKLLVTQIAISAFGFVLTFAAGSVDNDSLRTGCSVFAVAFYLFLVYTSIWDLGAKDALSIEYGHREYRPLTGLWIALLANAINFLLALLILLGVALPDASFFGNVGAVSKIIALFAQGMYSGLLSLRIGTAYLNSFSLSYFLMPLPAILTATAAYFFGLKNKRFTRLFDLKNDTTKRK